MADVRKTVDFIREKERICDAHVACFECPLSARFNGHDINCGDLILFYTDEALDILQHWVDGAKPKTFADDFYEKFPNAPRTPSGTPGCCWGNVYGDGWCDYAAEPEAHACSECWLMPFGTRGDADARS